MNIQRYDMELPDLEQEGKMEPRTEGEYVRFEDHEKALAELIRERDLLARWKAEHLTVESWWGRVDAAVRAHPEALLGDTVADIALRLIQERDGFKKLTEEAITEMEKMQAFYPRPQ